MKRIVRYAMLAAAATILFSCNKEQEAIFEDNATDETITEQTVTFVAEPVVETKTVFGDQDGTKYPTLWTNTEKVEISLNFATPKDATVVPSVDQKTASLQAVFATDGSGSYTFYALSPKSAYQGSISENRWGFAIATSQTPVTGSVDEKAQVLAAKSSTVTTFPTSPISLSFTHLTAYACMSLKNLVDLGSETISSITIVAGSNIAGRWYYNTSTGALSEWSASNTVTVNTSASTNIWFALAPVDLNGKSFKVVVNTTGGTVTKEITWPSGKAFTAGHVAKFNINMSGAALVPPKVYNLITDIDELTNDSEVLIVGASTSTSISTNQQTNNRADAAITKVGTTITDPADNVEVFTVKAGTKDNTYAFLATTESGYIYAASSSSNWLRTDASKTDDSSFSIGINEVTGEATVVAQGSNTRNHLRHNSDGFFSCYAESSSVTEKVVFYKLDGSGDPVRHKVSIAADIEAEVIDDDILVTWTDPSDANVDHYLVTCTGESNQVVDPADGGCSFEDLSDGDYTITITAIAVNPSTHKNSTTWTSSSLIVGATYHYEALTAAPADWTAETYIIVAGTAVLDGGVSSNWGTKKDVTIESDGTIKQTAAIEKCEITVAGDTKDGYTLYLANADSPVFVKALTTKSFATEDSATTTVDLAIGSIANHSSTSWKLRLNGQYRWYSSDTGTLAVLYKKVQDQTSSTPQNTKV